MKPKKRIIFTLLYNSNKFVLSRNFRLQTIGDLDWLKRNYNFDNVAYHIDELLILDVTRGEKDSEEFCKVVTQISENIFVPLTIGGGINSLEKAKLFFKSGADKVSINSSLLDENLVNQIVKNYGKQCLVGSIDVLKKNGEYYVYSKNGTKLVSSLNEFFENKEFFNNIGEIYINSINQDGTGNGLDISLAEFVSSKSEVPFIISGGVGKITDIKDALKYDFINAVSTAHLLNFIGDSLKKTRLICDEFGVNLAKWPSIDVILNRNLNS